MLHWALTFLVIAIALFLISALTGAVRGRRPPL